MPNLTATIPHQLSRAEAKARLQQQIQSLRTQQGAMLAGIEDTWTDDRMDFKLQAMGQSVTGHMLVDDAAVHVSVALPWLLSMVAGTIKHRLEGDVRRLLQAPAAHPNDKKPAPK